MRNLVTKNDHNRSSVHPDRTKTPPNTLEEGLLDYYAENAENVAQSVYKDACDRVVLSRGSENHKFKPSLGDQEIPDGEIEIYEGPENDLLAFLETFHDCAR